ncbi:uncharacterized protein LOC124381234 [Silurus meridionalis]|uniref:uncharacterized protein LOC124381234 n=1 Tax=Silurus meridionalis TaxID=175797 RepID=UPI001EECF0D1|nr:uncharacterized protein LOC124381234 [Silurus meridionalis]
MENPEIPPSTPSLSTDRGDEEEDHPWPYLESMFAFVGVKDNSYRMKCLPCLPKDCKITSLKNSPSNLKKHIKFNPAELAFLSEYAAVMTPATNILQAETNIQMGWLLPTVKLLKIKLNRIKLRLKYCKPIVDALQVGIDDRFGPMIEDPELVAAAILLPKLKTNWTQEDETIKIERSPLRGREAELHALNTGGRNPQKGVFFRSL